MHDDSDLPIKERPQRQIVKSEFATIKLPELDLEMPATSKRAILTTVEGLLIDISDDLSSEQPVRMVNQKLRCQLLRLFNNTLLYLSMPNRKYTKN